MMPILHLEKADKSKHFALFAHMMVVVDPHTPPQDDRPVPWLGSPWHLARHFFFWTTLLNSLWLEASLHSSITHYKLDSKITAIYAL